LAFSEPIDSQLKYEIWSTFKDTCGTFENGGAQPLRKKTEIPIPFCAYFLLTRVGIAAIKCSTV